MITYIFRIVKNINDSFVWLKQKQSSVLSVSTIIKTFSSKKHKIVISFVVTGIILSELIFGEIIFQNKIESVPIPDNISSLAIIQGNSLLAVSNFPQLVPVKKLPMIITAYSSTVWETDEDPFITASGSTVRDGIVANNILPFGTKIRIPELYGNKIFIVEDRMHWRKSNYHVDIWFPSHWEAKNFGVERTYVEILES